MIAVNDLSNLPTEQQALIGKFTEVMLRNLEIAMPKEDAIKGIVRLYIKGLGLISIGEVVVNLGLEYPTTPEQKHKIRTQSILARYVEAPVLFESFEGGENGS